MASSILEELLERSNAQAYNKADIKTRGDHLVISAINLIEDIKKNYDPETAEMLERRLLSAIKSKDARKFRFNKTNT